MAGNYPFLFSEKKLLCMFICLVQFVGFALLAIFAASFKDGKIEDSDAYPEDVNSMKARYMTAMLIFAIAGGVVHLLSAAGVFFEHLYITAGIALLEVATVVGALLEAIMIHYIFWFAFGLALFSLAMLALHIFDLMAIQNIHPESYQKPHRSSPPTADAEDSE